MARGRQFIGHNYGTAATAELVEDKSVTQASNCEVWKLDVEHYNRTGEVRKLEHLRTEQKPKVSKLKYNDNGHFVYVKE